ncbi:MAG TPA: hypothetical protein VIV60_19945, partial [Polyangiaceae bacterium]
RLLFVSHLRPSAPTGHSRKRQLRAPMRRAWHELFESNQLIATALHQSLTARKAPPNLRKVGGCASCTLNPLQTQSPNMFWAMRVCSD